jgi:hypothetical protein
VRWLGRPGVAGNEAGSRGQREGEGVVVTSFCSSGALGAHQKAVGGGVVVRVAEGNDEEGTGDEVLSVASGRLSVSLQLEKERGGGDAPINGG